MRLSVLVSLPSCGLNRVCTEDETPTGAVVVHTNVKVPSPSAVHANSMSLPNSASILCGGAEITGGSTERKEEGTCIIHSMRCVEATACCNVMTSILHCDLINQSHAELPIYLYSLNVKFAEMEVALPAAFVTTQR